MSEAAELVLKTLNLGKNGLGCLRCVEKINIRRTGNDDLEGGSHRVPAEAMQFQTHGCGAGGVTAGKAGKTGAAGTSDGAMEIVSGGAAMDGFEDSGSACFMTGWFLCSVSTKSVR